MLQPFNSLEEKLNHVIALMEYLVRDHYEDINETISFMKNICHNQWKMLDQMTSLRHGQKHLQEHVDHPEGRVEHMEAHSNEAFHQKHKNSIAYQPLGRNMG